jgi:succinylarginine dihydrolase
MQLEVSGHETPVSCALPAWPVRSGSAATALDQVVPFHDSISGAVALDVAVAPTAMHRSAEAHATAVR